MMVNAPVWFWQRILTPHMFGLASVVRNLGYPVTYIAEQPMSADRAAQGWTVPKCAGVHVEFVRSRQDVRVLCQSAAADSIHICQGIRANGLVGQAQRSLRDRGLRQWAVMETVDDRGIRGPLKRLEYRRIFQSWQDDLEGVLAIGYRTREWVIRRGVLPTKVAPFAYFLAKPELAHSARPCSGTYRFVFVGQFISRKRLDLLIAAVSALRPSNVELAVVGSGPLEAPLRAAALAALGTRLKWIGRLPMEDVPSAIATCDCLVLPSEHDGWGAVVSEALMAGVPAICSDRCGAAGVVAHSGVGGVFKAGNLEALVAEMRKELARGPLDTEQRGTLARWAESLGADAGARYLSRIISRHSGLPGVSVPAPWASAPHLLHVPALLPPSVQAPGTASQ